MRFTSTADGTCSVVARLRMDGAMKPFPPYAIMAWTRKIPNVSEIYRVTQSDCRGFNNLPPRSPDTPPCDFFLWGYVKDQVYDPPLLASIRN